MLSGRSEHVLSRGGGGGGGLFQKKIGMVNGQMMG